MASHSQSSTAFLGALSGSRKLSRAVAEYAWSMLPVHGTYMRRENDDVSSFEAPKLPASKRTRYGSCAEFGAGSARTTLGASRCCVASSPSLRSCRSRDDDSCRAPCRSLEWACHCRPTASRPVAHALSCRAADTAAVGARTAAAGRRGGGQPAARTERRHAAAANVRSIQGAEDMRANSARTTAQGDGKESARAIAQGAHYSTGCALAQGG